MKTAVIYARYSSDRQTEQSIEGQVRVCKEYAKQNNILIIDQYIDRAMTGTNDNRAAFQKMLKDSYKRQWNYILVYKLDRFSRNKYESTIHKKTLRDNGVTILSAMENLSDSPEGRMMETILEGFNQYFSEELTQKVNRGLRESWSKGQATGGVIVFGYDVVNKKYVPNAVESEIVLEMFSKYAHGYTAREIAEDITKRGFRRKNGKYVDHKFVYTVLHNSKYTGKVTHQGVVYDNIFPRLISDELWNQVLDINEQNKVIPTIKKDKFEYLLTGKLVCGCCNHKMSGESGTSRNMQKHYYYLCLSRRLKRAICDKHVIKKDVLEDLVINTTTAILNNPENINLLAEQISNRIKKLNEDNPTLKLLLKQQANAKKASGNLIKAIEQGIITEQTKTRLAELEQEITALDFDIGREKQRCYSFVTKDNIKEYLENKVFANTADKQIRKFLIKTFIREVILYDDRIYIDYNFVEPKIISKLDKEHVNDTEKQIEDSIQSAFTFNLCSSTFGNCRPIQPK